MGIYIVFTIVYVIVSTRKGVSSTAWNSISELVALALNSQRPTALQYTSAGINASETYRQPVCVREKDGDGVQLVFKEDLDVQRANFRQVAVDKLY